MATERELIVRLRGKVMDLPEVNELFDNQEELEKKHYSAALVDAKDEFNESVILTNFTLTGIRYTGILLELGAIHLLTRIILMISRNELPYTHQEINVNMDAKIRALERIIALISKRALPRLREVKASININSNMMSGISFW